MRFISLCFLFQNGQVETSHGQVDNGLNVQKIKQLLAIRLLKYVYRLGLLI